MRRVRGWGAHHDPSLGTRRRVFAVGWDRREFLRIGGLSLGGLSLPTLLERPVAGLRSVQELREGQELHHPVPLGRGLASRHVRPEARRAGRDPWRVRHDRHRDTRCSVHQVSARDGEAHGSHRPGALDDSHIVGARDRRLHDVYRSDLSEDRERGQFHGAPGVAPHRLRRWRRSRRDRDRCSRSSWSRVDSTPVAAGAPVSGGGSLGSKYDPMQTGGDPNRDDFRLENLPLLGECAPAGPGTPARAGRPAQPADALSQRERPGPLAEAEPGKSPGRHRLGGDPTCGRTSPRPTPASGRGTARNLFGQSVLLGRRLLDAGARLIQVNWLRTQGREGLRLGQSPREFRGPTGKT